MNENATGSVIDHGRGRPMRRPVRFHAGVLLVLAMGWLLAACHQGVLTQDAAFDHASGPGSAGTGLVIVGLRVLREPVQKSFLGDVHYRPVYDVHFREITAQGNFGRNQREIQVCDSIRALLNGILSDCQPNQLQYKVLSVPAGRYTLEYIGYKMGDVRVITNFNSAGGGGLFSARPVRSSSQSFTVNAGDIVYVGDLNFFFDRDKSAARMELGRHDDLAARALTTFPNVHGRMTFQSALGDTPTDSVPSDLLPIEGPL